MVFEARIIRVVRSRHWSNIVQISCKYFVFVEMRHYTHRFTIATKTLPGNRVIAIYQLDVARKGDSPGGNDISTCPDDPWRVILRHL